MHSFIWGTIVHFKFLAIAMGISLLNSAASSEEFSLGDMSEYKVNNCPMAQGAFIAEIEKSATEVVYESPNPTHAVMFLVCNMNQSNVLRVRVDSSPEDVGGVDRECMVVSVRTRLAVSNGDQANVQLACIKPFKMTRIGRAP